MVATSSSAIGPACGTCRSGGGPAALASRHQRPSRARRVMRWPLAPPASRKGSLRTALLGTKRPLKSTLESPYRVDGEVKADRCS
eukprot:scaffold825_cov249-Pinguiococcus_pyrenoidosus.AAC.7